MAKALPTHTLALGSGGGDYCSLGLPRLRGRALVSAGSSSFLGKRVCCPGGSPRNHGAGRLRREPGKPPDATINSVLADVAKNFMAQPLEAPVFERPLADPGTVASIILGGGAGTRLFPLTRRRAKPAVSIAYGA